MKRVTSSCAAALAIFVQATAVHAHHSFAGFDMAKTETVSGTLIRFDFSAPHARVLLARINDQGATEDLQIMTGSPTQLLRKGFDPRLFHRGDKITIVYHPARNGAPGGQMMKLIMADGKELIDPSEASESGQLLRQNQGIAPAEAKPTTP